MLLVLLFTIATAQECRGLKSFNDCISRTSCFWNSPDGFCEDFRVWEKTSDARSSCDNKVDMASCYSLTDCFWISPIGECESVDNWNFHTNEDPDPASLPCDSWTYEDDCWTVQKCFWNKRTYECLALHPHGGAEPTAALPLAFLPEVFMRTTKNLDAMNMCETFMDHGECALNDDCVWNDNSMKCIDTNGDCHEFDGAHLCELNHECTWTNNECQSPCETIHGEANCAYSKDCFWSTDTCLHENTACKRLMTASFCAHNDQCFWNENQGCLSFFGPCDVMSTEHACTTADQCQWSKYSKECLAAGVITTDPPIINCEHIMDPAQCELSESTEHGVACFWSEVQNKCEEYKFDCEDYMEAETCNAASYGGITCHWDGECDELKMQNVHDPSPADPLGNDQLFLEIVVGLGLFLGVVFAFCLHRYYTKSFEYEIENMQEQYVDITLH